MDNKEYSEYSVGYRKPPRHAQFKPGKSGNIKGRPRNVRNLLDLVLRELRSFVMVKDGNKGQRISKLEAIIKQHINRAANGDPKSTAIVFALLKPAEADRDNNLPELLQEFRKKNAHHTNEDRKRAEDDAAKIAAVPDTSNRTGA